MDQFVPTSQYASTDEFYGIEKMLPELNKQQMAQDWKDARIKAIFLMAPAWGWIFKNQDLQTVKVPTYIVAPARDRVLVTQNNAGFFAKNITNTIYQTIPGKAGHYVFISVPGETNNIPPYLITDPVGVDRRWIQFEVAGNAVTFFHTIFSQEQ